MMNQKIIGVIHAYPSEYLVSSLYKAGYQVVIFGNGGGIAGMQGVLDVVDLPLWDENKTIHRILEYNNNNKLDALLPVNEGTVSLTAKASKELGLPCLDEMTAVASRNKFISYMMWKIQGIPVPKSYAVYTGEDTWTRVSIDLKGRGILKPVDSMNSQGVILVSEKTDCDKAFNQLRMLSDQDIDVSSEDDRNRFAYGRSDLKYMVQEYCDGKEFSVELFLSEESGDRVLAILEKVESTNPYFAEFASISPTSVDTECENVISNLALKSVKALGYKNGPAHVEVRYSGDSLKVIEAGLRPGGGFIPQIVERLSGENIFEMQAKHACSNLLNLTVKNCRDHFLFGGVIYQKTGKISEIRGMSVFDKIQGLEELIILGEVGESVRAMPVSAQPHFCYYLLRSDSYESAVSTHMKIQDSIKLTIEEETEL